MLVIFQDFAHFPNFTTGGGESVPIRGWTLSNYFQLAIRVGANWRWALTGGRVFFGIVQ